MPPTTCWKNEGRPQRLSTRPIRSMSAVTVNAATAVIGAAPSSRAIDPASTAQPRVATQRGYGCGALTASVSRPRRPGVDLSMLHPVDDLGDLREPGEVQRPVADQPHRRDGRGRPPAVAET